MNMRNRQPRQIGGKPFVFIAHDYPTRINKQARELSAKGYSYRIFHSGRKRILYIGPKQKARKVKKKKIKKIKKIKKVKK